MVNNTFKPFKKSNLIVFQDRITLILTICSQIAFIFKPNDDFILTIVKTTNKY